MNKRKCCEECCLKLDLKKNKNHASDLYCGVLCSAMIHSYYKPVKVSLSALLKSTQQVRQTGGTFTMISVGKTKASYIPTEGKRLQL